MDGLTDGPTDGQAEEGSSLKTHLLLFAASVFRAVLVTAVLLSAFVCSFPLAPEGWREGTFCFKKEKTKLDETTTEGIH